MGIFFYLMRRWGLERICGLLRWFSSGGFLVMRVYEFWVLCIFSIDGLLLVVGLRIFF